MGKITISGRTLTKRPLLAWLPFLLAGLVCGAGLVSYAGLLWPLAAAGVALLLALIFLTGRNSLTALGLVFFLIGAAAGSADLTPPKNPDNVYYLVNTPGLVFGGRVAEPPRASYGRLRLIIETGEVLPLGGRSRPASGLIQLTVKGDRSSVEAGDWVRFPALLRRSSGFANPGTFDYERYLCGRGLWVSAFLKSPDLMVITGPPEDKFTLPRLRSRAASFIEAHVGQPARGLMMALLLGRPDAVEDDVRLAFQRLGLAHLLAVSGLHIGLIALASVWLLRRLMLLKPSLALRFDVPRTSIALSIVPVLFYAALAGGRPSTMRAAVMVTVFILAVLVQRRKDPLTALAAAAWVILLLDPSAVFTASFQLSFAAAGAIILLAPRFPASPFQTSYVPGAARNRKSLPQWAWGLAVITLAATLGTAPIAAAHFHRVPLLGLPANLIFTPLISLLIIPFGLLALALMPIWPAAAAILLAAIEKALWIILAPLETAAAWPDLELLAPGPGLVFLVWYYLLLAAVFLVKPRKKALTAAVALLAVGGLVWTGCRLIEKQSGRMKVTVLDVGQGLSVHVGFPDGTQMVIDGGGFPGSDFDPGEELVGPYLLGQGLTRVNILALSHPQTDHAAGLVFLARTFNPDALWTNGAPSGCAAYENLMTAAEEFGLARLDPAGLEDPRLFGRARVEILAPDPDYKKGLGADDLDRRSNDFSLVIKITLGRFSFLFPGDIEEKGEADLIRRAGSNLRADVLVAPHHGSRTSLTPGFLEAVDPQFVVFSVGRYNRFGMPDPRSLARCRAAQARILRTDMDGAVRFVTDGQTLAVETVR